MIKVKLAYFDDHARLSCDHLGVKLSKELQYPADVREFEYKLWRMFIEIVRDRMHLKYGKTYLKDYRRYKASFELVSSFERTKRRAKKVEK